MHSKTDMWDLCTAYCILIHSLINNADDPNRAQIAIDTVKNYAHVNRCRVTNLVKDYI